MENKNELPCGVRVVEIVSDDKPYILNEKALTNILLSEDVADCVVSVVSIAGPCRSGKSFLLDYMLRYLYADDKARQNNSWAGEPNQPLKGFSWCGGDDPVTTGLLLWSQPVHMVLPSGQPVVVLLIDTQGSFDCNSTVCDNSTIFALSTLMSSIQIYNLSQNIREDDLRNLQLFTEYGRKASETRNDFKPFQKFMFLVRDWIWHYELSYGTEGGQQLLEKRLKINQEQVEELKIVRRHINDCFQSTHGFLMPCPGSKISDPDFKGCLSDLSSSFKNSLLELIPLVLAPENLQPRQINGQIVKARDLHKLFKFYVEVFNSNELPQPQSLMKATSEWALLSAVESARNLYRIKMESIFTKDAPCVSHVVLDTIHERTCCEAMEFFRRRKGMIEQQAMRSRGDLLLQELNSEMKLYERINEGKIQKLRGNAKKVYEESMSTHLQEDGRYFCFHPKDLEQMHGNAIKITMQLFDTKINNKSSKDDEQRLCLLDELEERYKQLCVLNISNNNMAVSAARDHYSSFIESVCGSRDCVSNHRLEREHGIAHEGALEIFESKRVRSFSHCEDLYKSHLGKIIEQNYDKIKELNIQKNKANVTGAIDVYRKRMAVSVAPGSLALHPQQLEQEHNEAIKAALDVFNSKRNLCEDFKGIDNYRDSILVEVKHHYVNVCTLNETNNILAVSAAYSGYCSSMDSVCTMGRMRLSVDALKDAHEQAHQHVLRIFKDKRFGNEEYNPDTHKDKLFENIRQRLDYYKEINERNLEQQELAVANNTELIMLAGGVVASTILVAGTAVVVSETVLGGSLASVARAATKAMITTALNAVREAYTQDTEIE